ncbi:MAG TPA: NAD(P)/FAD-dependent oxidoreductase [Sphingobium sp.]
MSVGLDALGAQVRRDLALLDHGKPDWAQPRRVEEGHVHDVLIVGGGQSGLGAAFGLLRQRIGNILILDENPAGYEGPWDTYARMVTLRTPKELTGIDLGVPSLTFRAFWEAQHGAAAWEAIDKIPRRDWMDYLRWYRRVLDLPVRNETRVTRVEPLDGGGLFRVHVEDGAPILSRKVVLATGIQGGGEWHVPSFVRDALPPERYAHTSAMIDFAPLAGKRIGLLGGGASAFDNAQTALGEGVGAVHVFLRREKLPRVNPIRFMERSGMTALYAHLSDAEKYRAMQSFIRRNQPPTNDTFARAAAYPGFRLHLGEPWLSVAETDAGVEVTTPKGRHFFDFLILSTGLVTDPALRPELAGLADRIACWRDRFVPEEGEGDAMIGAHPYLGAGFELLPRRAEDAAAIHGLFAFNYSAFISHGISASALSGLKHAIPRLVDGLARQLFLDDRAGMLAAYHAYDEPEFLGEWAGASEGEPAR